MADTSNASASDTSKQSTVDRAVDIVLKNIGTERESRFVDRDVRKIWRTLGAAWRACANRVVSTVLVRVGERRTAELGQAFPCADGVVLDLLGSGTSAVDALDVQVWLSTFFSKCQPLNETFTRLTVKLHAVTLCDPYVCQELLAMMSRSDRLRQVVVAVHSARDSLVATIQKPEAQGGDYSFRACLNQILERPMHDSGIWVENPCVVSIKHHIPDGVPRVLGLVAARDKGTIACNFLHTSFLERLMRSKSLLELQISRPLTILGPEHIAIQQDFSRLTTLTSIEAPDVAALFPVGSSLKVHSGMWKALANISGIKHVAVMNTASGISFNRVEGWGQLTALTSLELGKPWGTAPAAKLLQMAKPQLHNINSWKQLQSLVVRATGTCFDDMPAPSSTNLTNLVLVTSPEARVPAPAWLLAAAPTIVRLELGPLDLKYEVFKALATAGQLESLTLGVASIHSTLLAASPHKTHKAVLLPKLGSLDVTFYLQGCKLLTTSHPAPFLLLLGTPCLQAATFSTLPSSPAFNTPGEWYMPLRQATAAGDKRWQAAARLFNSCTVVVEDGERDLTEEALACAKKLLPHYTGGLAMWLGQKVSPDALSRLMGIWPSPDVVMRSYQHLPALLRHHLTYRTPLALSGGHVKAMKMPATSQPPTAGGASSAERDIFRRFKNVDIQNCELLKDDGLVAAADICQRGGNLQFHGAARATDALFEQLIDAGIRLRTLRFWGASVANLTTTGCKALLQAGAADSVFLQQGGGPGQWLSNQDAGSPMDT